MSLAQKTDAYWNLHKKLWSLKRSRVFAHEAEVLMVDCTFVVQPAGRVRVLKEKRKNVHAFVRGLLASEYRMGSWPVNEEWIPVGYNPYKGGTFVRKDTGEPLKGAEVVLLRENGTAVALNVEPFILADAA